MGIKPMFRECAGPLRYKVTRPFSAISVISKARPRTRPMRRLSCRLWPPAAAAHGHSLGTLPDVLEFVGTSLCSCHVVTARQAKSSQLLRVYTLYHDPKRDHKGARTRQSDAAH
jgi:hypothetical protein